MLAPTRELAAQILEDLKDLAVHTPVSGAAVFGGVGHGPQEHAFRSGVDVIIATPGRLLDHLRSPYAQLDQIKYLVLDEADRMLDMGFLPEIRKILRHLPARRQTLFFSATMPPPIRQLAREMLHHPVSIERERQGAPPTGITQAVYPVPQELKSSLLVTLLRRGDITQALVFTRTKHRANRLADYLVREGMHADRIHGNRSQGQRTAALAAFKSGPRARCSWRRTSPRAASTSTRSATSSTSTCRSCPTTTSIASAAPAAPRRPARRSRSSRPTSMRDLAAIERGDRPDAAARDRARLRLHRAAARRGSRFRSRSASRRFARANRRNGGGARRRGGRLVDRMGTGRIRLVSRRASAGRAAISRRTGTRPDAEAFGPAAAGGRGTPRGRGHYRTSP